MDQQLPQLSFSHCLTFQPEAKPPLMTIENNRLIMELDEYRRTVNREKINPTLTKVELNTLAPVVTLCAKARASYIECLMALANSNSDTSCTAEEIEDLRQHRMTYEELVSAANALETVIKRGYVDVKQS